MAFNDEEEDTTFDEVSSMADRLGLQGQKRAAYIDDHMVQLGYDAVQSRQSYVRRQQQGEDEGSQGNAWGFGRRSQGSSRNQGRQRRDDGDQF